MVTLERRGKGWPFLLTFNSQRLLSTCSAGDPATMEKQQDTGRSALASNHGRAGVGLVGKTGSLKAKLSGIVSLRYTGPRGGYDGNDGSIKVCYSVRVKLDSGSSICHLKGSQGHTGFWDPVSEANSNAGSLCSSLALPMETPGPLCRHLSSTPLVCPKSRASQAQRQGRGAVLPAVSQGGR